MRNKNFSFELKRNWWLDSKLSVKETLIDHLLIPFYAFVGLMMSIAHYPSALILYFYRKGKR